MQKMIRGLRKSADVDRPREVVALAALIYLRWVDFVEAEEEAFESLVSQPYEPVLPLHVQWRSFYDLPFDRLQRVFSYELPFVLESFENVRDNPIATQLHRIAPAIRRLAELDPEIIHTLLRWLGQQPFETPQDRLAIRDALDDFLPDVTKGSRRDFEPLVRNTPTFVRRLMVELAAPDPGSSIYDPCFGGAYLLTEAIDYSARRPPEHTGTIGRPIRGTLLVGGIERNSHAYVIGLARLVLSGVDDPQLEQGNALERLPSNGPKSGFDVVLANPPWGGKIDPAGLNHIPIRSTDSTSLFIQHALFQLAPGCRAVIVVPPSILFGSIHALLRQFLLQQHTVEAVIALPERSFSSTSIKPHILVLRRGGSTKTVRMVDLSDVQQKKSDAPEILGKFSTPAEIAALVRDENTSDASWDVDVETLAQIDWDLTPKRRDQSGLQIWLNSLSDEIEVRKLDQICEITSGRSFRPEELQDVAPKSNFEPSGETLFDEIERAEINRQRPFAFADNPIPYIRIRDVQNGIASRGSAWLAPVAASSADPKWKLRAGDILLSKSGTIGKAGIVRNGAVGGVAASGFFVLRVNGDVLDPHYLMAYLKSAECNAWLEERSRGFAAKHLSVGFIKELPIAVPSLQIQQRIGAECRELGTDALDLLAKVLTGTESNRISELIDRIWPMFAASHNDDDHRLSLSAWSRLANEVRAVRNDVAHGQGDGGELTRWILMFNEALSPLRGAESIPPGPALMSVLRDALQRAEKAERSVEGDLPDQTKARSLTRLFAKWIQKESVELMRHSRIVFTANVTEFTAEQPTELTLEIENQGSLPIRNLLLTTEPDWGVGDVTYLPEGERSKVDLFGVAPTDAGKFNLTIRWSAVALNGEPLEGARDIGFDVICTSEAADATPVDIGGSPYVCGDPVKAERNDVFFGREDLIAQIRRQIVQSGNVVLLEGNRRAGKSSVLWHLEGQTAVPGWLGVYCSLQGTEGDSEGGIPTAEVFRGMAYEIVQSVRKLNGSVVLPDGSTLDGDRRLGIARSLRQGISQEAPFQDFREYLELILETLAKQNLGLLLMLDEFDKLQEGIDKGITSPQVPENIRFLVQSFPKFSAILTGSRRLKRMREEYWSALFGLGTRLGVSALPLEAASRLITEPVKGRLSYAKSAVERAYELTAGQPYLLQCLCNRVFDIAARSGIRSITIDQVNDAAAALVEDNEHFASLWDYTKFDRCRFLLYMLHREESGPDPMRLGVIEAKLEEAGVELREEIIIADLEYLRELELVDLHGESSGAYYTLTIPMMGQWLDAQQDYEILRSRARAEAEDLSGKMREVIRLHAEMKELKDSMEDDDD